MLAQDDHPPVELADVLVIRLRGKTKRGQKFGVDDEAELFVDRADVDLDDWSGSTRRHSH